MLSIFPRIVKVRVVDEDSDTAQCSFNATKGICN